MVLFINNDKTSGDGKKTKKYFEIKISFYTFACVN
jgi:hypothetical protein